MKPCIICDKLNPYKNLEVCDDCHDTYELDELKELIRAYYQNLYDRSDNEDLNTSVTHD